MDGVLQAHVYKLLVLFSASRDIIMLYWISFDCGI